MKWRIEQPEVVGTPKQDSGEKSLYKFNGLTSYAVAETAKLFSTRIGMNRVPDRPIGG